MRLDQRPAGGTLRPRAKLLLLFCGLCLSSVVIAAGILTYKAEGLDWLTWQWQRVHLLEVMAELGNGAMAAPEGSVATLAMRLPGRWMESILDTEVEMPQLMLDVRFKHIRKIYHRRQQALEQGVLIQEKSDLVPGTLRIAGRSVRVKIRLKGDWTDHLEGDKWSFRVETRDGDHVLGMRRFSLQHPKVRGFQSEIMYLQLLRRVGVLAPRYQFVNVTLNGKDLGVMALEEHFSKEILESQSRREGVIVRFDESLLWSTTDGALLGFQGIYDDFRNAAVDGFRLKKIAESETLSRQYEVAVGLLRGFVERRLSAAEVFDPQTTGKYLAVAEFVGSRHPTRWHNQRFYLNPITLRFEPIGFDADLHNRIGGEALVSPHEPMVVQMLEDPIVRAEFQTALNSLIDATLNGDLLTNLQHAETQYLRELRKEFYLIEGFPYEYLRDRARFLQTVSVQAFITPNYPKFAGVGPLTKYPQPTQAYYYHQGDKTLLQLGAATPYPVTVDAIKITPAPREPGPGEGPVDKPPAIKIPLSPVKLLPRAAGQVPTFAEVQIDPIPAGATLEISGQMVSSQQTIDFQQQVAPYSRTFDKSPIPASQVAEQLAAHGFLTLDPSTSEIRVHPGRWNVRASIIVPVGFSLVIDAGTTLTFDSDAGLYAKGPLVFNGNVDAPIVLTADGNQASWPGVAVLQANGRSTWRHVQVERTRGVSVGPWRLTGGVTFYQSPVTLDAASFSDHLGEDALNIVSSQFEMRETTVEGAASDGFDCDYCQGVVRGGVFRRISGDAIDISLSEVEISGTHFEQVADKALSIGEKSIAKVSNVTVDRVGTGAAVKDGSTLELAESTISNTNLAGLMAYIKKPEFGAARLDATNLQLIGDSAKAIAQTGSVIMLNGTELPTQDVDVDEMYATSMRPSIEK